MAKIKDLPTSWSTDDADLAAAIREKESIGDSLAQGLRSGALGAGAQLQAVAGMGGELVGANDFAAARYKGARDLSEQAQAAAPSISSYHGVNGVRDALKYGAGMVGQSLPVSAAALGAAALTGGGAIPGLLAAGAATAPFEIGDAVMRQQQDPEQAKLDVTQRAANAAISGGTSAAVQSVVPAIVGGKIMGKTAANAAKKSTARIIGGGVADAGLEGVTEGAGEFIKQKGEQQLNPTKQMDWDAIAENTIGGAAGGAALGGIGVAGELAHGNGERIGGFVGSARDKLQAGAKIIGDKVGQGADAVSEAVGPNGYDLGGKTERATEAASNFVGRMAGKAKEEYDGADIQGTVDAAGDMARGAYDDASKFVGRMADKAKAKLDGYDLKGAADNAGPMARSAADSIVEFARGVKDKSKQYLGRIANGDEFVEPENFQGKTGEALKTAIELDDNKRTSTVTDVFKRLWNDKALSAEDRATLQAAGTDLRNKTNQAIVAGVAKARMTWNNTKGMLEALNAGLKQGKEDPGTKKSEDYAGLDKIVYEAIAPTINKELPHLMPQGYATTTEQRQLASGLRRVVGDLLRGGDYEGGKRTSYETLLKLLPLTGEHTVDLIEKAAHAMNRVKDPEAARQFYSQMKTVMDVQSGYKSLKDVVRSSMPEGQRDEDDVARVAEGMLKWVNTPQASGKTPEQSRYEDARIQRALNDHFGKNAGKIRAAAEALSKSIKGRLEGEARKEEGDFNPDELDYEATLGGDEDGDGADFNDKLTEHDAPARDTNTRLRVYGGKLLESPDVATGKGGFAPASVQALQRMKERYPQHRVRWVSADELGMDHPAVKAFFNEHIEEANKSNLSREEGLKIAQGKLGDMGMVGADVSDSPLSFTGDEIAKLQPGRQKNNPKRFIESAANIRTNAEGAETKVVDAVKLVNEMKRRFAEQRDRSYADLSKTAQDGKMLIEGLAALQEYYGHSIEVDDSTVINKAGTTWGQAKEAMKPKAEETSSKAAVMSEQAIGYMTDGELRRGLAKVEAAIDEREDDISTRGREIVEQMKDSGVRLTKQSVKEVFARLRAEYPKSLDEYQRALSSELSRRHDDPSGFNPPAIGIPNLARLKQKEKEGVQSNAEDRIVVGKDANGADIYASREKKINKLEQSMWRLREMGDMEGAAVLRDEIETLRAPLQGKQGIRAQNAGLDAAHLEHNEPAPNDPRAARVAELRAEMEAIPEKNRNAGGSQKYLALKGEIEALEDAMIYEGPLGSGRTAVDPFGPTQDVMRGKGGSASAKGRGLKAELTKVRGNENPNAVIRTNSDGSGRDDTVQGRRKAATPAEGATRFDFIGSANRNEVSEDQEIGRIGKEFDKPSDLSGRRPSYGQLTARERASLKEQDAKVAARVDEMASKEDYSSLDTREKVKAFLGAAKARYGRLKEMDRQALNNDTRLPPIQQKALYTLENLFGPHSNADLNSFYEGLEGSPDPKAVAAKKAAFLEKARSGDEALIDHLSKSDDAKGLQRAAEALVGEQGEGAAKTAAAINTRLRELTQNEDMAYGMLTKKYSLMRVGGAANDDGRVLSFPDRKSARIRREVEEIVGQMSDEDFHTLQNDVLARDPNWRPTMPSALKESFREWLREYSSDESEAMMSPEQEGETEARFYEAVMNGDWGAEPLERALAGAILSGARLKKLSAERTDPNAQGPRDLKSVLEYVRRVLGDSVQVNLRAEFDHAGEFEEIIRNDGALERVIRVSASALNPMSTAHHEALHALFSHLSGMKLGPVMDALERSASSIPTMLRLRELLKDSPEALAQLSNPEERVAYMYQFWSTGDLKVNPEATTFFGKIAAFVRQVLGIWSNDERALHILKYFDEGRFAEGLGKRNHRDIVSRDLMEPGRNAALEALKKMAAPITNMGERLAVAGHQRLRDTGIPALRELADIMKLEGTGEGKDPGFIPAARSERARRMNELGEVLAGLSEEEKQAALEAMQNGNDDAINALEGEARVNANLAREVLRATLDSMYHYMREAGVDVADLGVGTDYFPRVWDPHYLSTHKAEFLAMADKYVRSGEWHGDPESTLHKMMNGDGNEFIVTDRPGMQALKPRLLAFVSHEDAAPFMNKNLYEVMNSYITQATRRAEWARRFDNDNKRLYRLMEQARQQGATEQDIDTANKYVRGIDGTLGDDISPEFRRMQGNIMVYQNLRLLPLAIFSSVVDPLGIMVRGGTMSEALSAFKRGIMEIPKSFKKEVHDDEMTQLAASLGTIDSTTLLHTLGTSFSQGMVGNTGRKINDAFFRFNLMEQFNTSMRVAATQAAINFIGRHADGKRDKHSARWMAELGFEPGEVKLDKNGKPLISEADGLTADEAGKMRLAINRWVDGAVLRPDAADKPIWMNDPHFALIAHLKQFTFSFQETILKRVAHEMKAGNYAPATALLSYVPVMIAADAAKGIIQGGGSEPAWKRDWGPAEYIESGIERGGLYGSGQFAVDAFKDVARGGIGIGALSGPTIEQLSDAIKTVGGREEFSSFALQSMPANALYAGLVRGRSPAEAVRPE